MRKPFFQSSAPGRVCLYGEHQDYLGLPVISAAVNLRTTLTARHRKDKVITVSSTNIPQNDFIYLDSCIKTGTGPYKYLRGVIKAIMENKAGWKPAKGLDVVIKSEIPVGAGLSSSAALLTSFTGLLDTYYELGMSIEEIAEISYIAEHNICGISCGRMDQYSSAIGDLIFLETGDEPKFQKFRSFPFPYLVIGDTLERRSADEALRVRKIELQHIKTKLLLHDFTEINMNEIDTEKLTTEEQQRLECVTIIRDITKQARVELEKSNPNPEILGSLMTQQHEQLRDNYHVSSPKLDELVNISLEHGASGAKLTGAGLSGCIVAVVVSRDELEGVVNGINEAGGKAIATGIAGGMTVTP